MRSCVRVRGGSVTDAPHRSSIIFEFRSTPLFFNLVERVHFDNLTADGRHRIFAFILNAESVHRT